MHTSPPEPEAVAKALDYLATLGPEVEAAAMLYCRAHEATPQQLEKEAEYLKDLRGLTGKEDTTESDAAADATRWVGFYSDAYRTATGADTVKPQQQGGYVRPRALPGSAAPQPTGKDSLSVGGLGMLVAAVLQAGTNEAWGGKMVAAHGAGALGAVVVGYLQRQNVSAVCLGPGNIAPHLLEGLHILSAAELATIEAELPPAYVARLAELRAAETQAGPVIEVAPQVLPVSGAMKAAAKAGRKVAGKEAIRRMLLQAAAKAEPFPRREPPRPRKGTPSTPPAEPLGIAAAARATIAGLDKSNHGLPDLFHPLSVDLGC